MELLVFMRTDVYFLLQDLAGCANLYADGSARIRYLTQRLRHALDHAGATPHDPAKYLPPRERRAVQAYSWVLLCGTVSSIAAAALFAAPAVITLLAHAISEITRASPADKSDGIAAIAVCCGFQIIWLRTWWRRHGHRVRDYRQTRKQPTSEGR